MQNDLRTFHVYDLEISARKDGASIPTMMEVLEVWRRMHANRTVFPMLKGNKNLVIGDFHHDLQQNYITILIRLSDKLAPNSVYSDLDTGAFNEHLKVGNQGADYGCHVIVSTAPEAAQANVYTCCVEKVTGLPAGIVQRMLSMFLHFEYSANEKFYQYPAPGGGLKKDGSPRMDRCLPHIEMRGRPSDTLINDINNGTLSGISLVKAEQVAPIAGAPYLIKQTSELKLSIDQGNLPAQVFQGLQHALQQNSGEYGIAKVSYKIPNSKRVVTVELNAATGQPLNDLYIEAYDIGPIFPPLAQSSQNIVQRLITPAVAEFLQKRAV